MEILGFKKAKDFLENNNLLLKLTVIIADKDGKVLKFIRENPTRFSHIEVIHQQACPVTCSCQDFNPHLFPMVEFSSLLLLESYFFPPDIVETIIFYSAQSFKDIICFSEVFKGWYLVTYKERFSILGQEFPKSKPILDSEIVKHQEKIDKITKFVSDVAEKASEFCHSGHTCTLESLHSVRANISDKDEYFLECGNQGVF